MKTFMKSIIAAAVVVMMIVMVPMSANANECDWGCNKKGITGLEITGASSVGVQLYSGSSIINSDSNNCLGSTSSVTSQTFDGVGLMSSANGSICVTGTKHSMGRPFASTGTVEGSGVFESGFSGEFSGEAYGIEGDIDFYTNSKVVLSGSSGGFNPCRGPR